MKDELIQYETAILAKEVGFDSSVIYYYDFTEFLSSGASPQKWNGSKESIYSAPTQSLIQRWLREEEDFLVYCTPNKSVAEVWHYNIDKTYSLLNINSEHFETYELALEAGLKKALELCR